MKRVEICYGECEGQMTFFFVRCSAFLLEAGKDEFCSVYLGTYCTCPHASEVVSGVTQSN